MVRAGKNSFSGASKVEVSESVSWEVALHAVSEHRRRAFTPEEDVPDHERNFVDFAFQN